MQLADILFKKIDSMKKKGVVHFSLSMSFVVNFFFNSIGRIFISILVSENHQIDTTQLNSRVLSSNTVIPNFREEKRFNYLYLKQYLIFRTLPPNLSCPGGHFLWDKETVHPDMVECLEEQSTCKVFNGKILNPEHSLLLVHTIM